MVAGQLGSLLAIEERKAQIQLGASNILVLDLLAGLGCSPEASEIN